MLGILRRNPRFRRLWLAQVVSELGDWMGRVAVLAVIGRLGGGAALGGVGMLYAGELAVRLLPASFFGPLAGPLADRVSRRLLMVLSDLVRALLVLGLLLVKDADDLNLLYGLLIAQMSASVFFQAARSAAVPGTLDRDELHAAYALTAATWSAMLSVGAVVGAFAIRAIGPEALFVLDALTYVVSAAFLIGLRLDATEAQPQAFALADVVLLRDIRRGWDHARERGLLPPLLAKTFWGGAGGYLVLLSVSGHEAAAPALHADGESAAAALAGFALGLMYGARGLGTGLGPLVARRLFGAAELSLRAQIALGFVVGALGYAVFGLVEGQTARFLAVVVAHMGGSTLWVASTTLWQRGVEDRFRGRVYACEFLGFTLTFTLGGALGGWIYDASGSVAWTAWSLSACVLAMGLGWSLWTFARPSPTLAPTADDEALP